MRMRAQIRARLPFLWLLKIRFYPFFRQGWGGGGSGGVQFISLTCVCPLDCNRQLPIPGVLRKYYGTFFMIPMIHSFKLLILLSDSPTCYHSTEVFNSTFPKLSDTLLDQFPSVSHV